MSQILFYKIKDLNTDFRPGTTVNCQNWQEVLNYINSLSVIVLNGTDYEDKSNLDLIYLIKNAYPEIKFIVVSNKNIKNSVIDFSIRKEDLNKLFEKTVIRNFKQKNKIELLKKVINRFLPSFDLEK